MVMTKTISGMASKIASSFWTKIQIIKQIYKVKTRKTVATCIDFEPIMMFRSSVYLSLSFLSKASSFRILRVRIMKTILKAIRAKPKPSRKPLMKAATFSKVVNSEIKLIREVKNPRMPRPIKNLIRECNDFLKASKLVPFVDEKRQIISFPPLGQI